MPGYRLGLRIPRYTNCYVTCISHTVCGGEVWVISRTAPLFFGRAAVAQKRTARRPTRSVPDVAPKQNASSDSLFEETVIVSRKEPTFRNLPGSLFSTKE